MKDIWLQRQDQVHHNAIDAWHLLKFACKSFSMLCKERQAVRGAGQISNLAWVFKNAGGLTSHPFPYSPSKMGI